MFFLPTWIANPTGELFAHPDAHPYPSRLRRALMELAAEAFDKTEMRPSSLAKIAALVFLTMFSSSCTRPPVISGKLAGAYFSSSGDAIVVQPGGSVNLIPSPSGRLSLTIGSDFYPAKVHELPSGSVLLKLSGHSTQKMNDATVEIAADGATATLISPHSPAPIVFLRH